LNSQDEAYLRTLSEFDSDTILADFYAQLKQVVEMNKAMKLAN
jgi:hypothetical protein